jgi:microcin C transport system permease protein
MTAIHFEYVTLPIILVMVYWLIHRLIPRLFVKTGRRLGFRMKLTPLTERRVRRFRQIRRGYFSYIAITTLFVTSFGLEMISNHKPLYIRYDSQWQAPAAAEWLNFLLTGDRFVDEARWRDFGLDLEGQVNGRKYAEWIQNPQLLEIEASAIEEDIQKDREQYLEFMSERAARLGDVEEPDPGLPEWKETVYRDRRAEAAALRRLKDNLDEGKARILMPPYPFSPRELLLHLPGTPPHKPLQKNGPLLGTDFAGRDVFSQILYGFRTSFSFAIMVALIGYSVGIVVGAAMGYFGGWFDIVVQRIIEVWSSIPFLFTLMIIASVVQPTFWILAFMLVLLRSWLGITYTIRGEFYREKSRDYVQAVRAIGFSNRTIMLKHILPNSLVPVVTFLPFGIVSYIGSLVSLDYLGFGLPPNVPSWGRLLNQGASNIVNHPHLVLIPVTAYALTLFCVVMIGEAVREAFDPKVYARLR